jgi:hypothetical protein
MEEKIWVKMIIQFNLKIKKIFNQFKILTILTLINQELLKIKIAIKMESI